MRRTAAALSVLACGLLASHIAQASGSHSSLPSSSPVPAGEQPYEYRLDGMSENLRFSDAVPSPKAFLGYEIGEYFTRHHDTVAYVKAIADASDRAIYTRYGQTHQRRELGILTISSPRNLARLDTILERNRSLARPDQTDSARMLEIAGSNPAVVWLSFNVHGNEASCTEAAQQLAYTLTASTNPEIARLLENVVVVIDPCLNPDGRARYIHWYEQIMGVKPDANPISREHREPWPGGRANHYLFDLNRDWIWATQPESRTRMAIYRQYMPQVHIDYHEQGIHSPYFMGAGDTPYSANIPEESKAGFDSLGRASAAVFDRLGLPYATKERFDYLYPGYGKVTPVYHGAISLLTEQAGHGRAGLTIDVQPANTPGYNLSLQDRTRNHFLTAMAYVEYSAKNRQAQLERFARYFRESAAGSSDTIAGFVFSASNDPAKLDRVWDLCNIHGINIYELSSEQTLDASTVRLFHPPFTPQDERVSIARGSWYIPTAQPMGRMALTAFERETFVEDRDTYDITSWSYPVMLGLDAMEVTAPLPSASLRKLDRFEPFPTNRAERPRVEDDFAVLVPSDQHRFPLALSIATEMNLFARLTPDTVELSNGKTVPAGSLMVMRIRNSEDDMTAFADRIWQLGLDIASSDTGYPPSGPALGNNANRRFITPNIVLAAGSPLSSLSFGHTWHMLDHVSPTPHTVVNIDDLGSVDWNSVNVLILPSGNVGRSITGSTLDSLQSWVRSGGTVIALQNSARWASSSLVGLSGNENTEDDDSPVADMPWDTTDRTPADQLHTLTYEQRRARSVDRRVPGALLSADVDLTHPLAAGLDPVLGFHVYSGSPLPVGNSGYVLARFGAFTATDDLDSQSFAPRIAGAISPSNLQRLAGKPAITHHSVGRGNVICFISDPTNRGMNHAGMRALLNTILLGPSMSGAQPLGEDEDDEHAH